jgi:hypothetical protein
MEYDFVTNILFCDADMEKLGIKKEQEAILC